MKRIIKDTWTGNYYQEQENSKWRCMGLSPQTTPIDTIEYTILPNSITKGRYHEESSFKILSFTDTYGNLVTLRDNGYYVVEGKEPKDCRKGLGATLAQELEFVKTGELKIHSVLRVKDKKYFTIEEEVRTKVSSSFCSIYAFNIIEGKLIINCTHSYLLNQAFPEEEHLQYLQKIDSFLFKSEDNVNIKLGDDYWVWDYGDLKESLHTIHKVNRASETHKGNGTNRKYFSTEKAAIEYRLMNSSCLTIEEIMAISYNPAESRTSSSRKLKELVKKKIDGKI